MTMLRSALIALACFVGLLLPSNAQIIGDGIWGGQGARALACTFSPTLWGTYNVAYTSGSPSASGGVLPYTYSETGSLPPGITLNTSTGVISGTYTTNAQNTYAGIQLKVTDAASTMVNCGASFSLDMAATLAMSYTPVTSATYNVAYTGATPSTSGGTTSYVYTSTGGALPPGMSISSSTGVISGTDTVDSGGATYAGIVVTVTDAHSRVVNSSPFTITVAASICTNAECTNWVNAVVGGGGTVSNTQKGYVNTLISCLKTASIFSTIDAYWLFASENVTQAKYDISGGTGSNLATSAPVGSPTFTASQGYAGNGTSSYINLNYAPSSTAVNLSLNSSTIGIYDRSSVAAFSTQVGAYTLGAAVQFLMADYLNSSNQTDVGLNDNSNHFNVGAGVAGHAGLHVASRTGTTSSAYYYNGSSKATSAIASVSLETFSLYALASNQTGSAGGFSTNQIAQVIIAAGWNATQQASFSTCANAYMTSLGTNVY